MAEVVALVPTGWRNLQLLKLPFQWSIPAGLHQWQQRPDPQLWEQELLVLVLGRQLSNFWLPSKVHLRHRSPVLPLISLVAVTVVVARTRQNHGHSQLSVLHLMLAVEVDSPPAAQEVTVQLEAVLLVRCG